MKKFTISDCQENIKNYYLKLVKESDTNIDMTDSA